jgi:hypothetical protein
MGAVSGEQVRAEAPHRWCTTTGPQLPFVPASPFLRLRRRSVPTGPVAPPSRDETATEARGPLARARFQVIEGGL